MKVDIEKVGIISSYFANNTKELYVTKLLKLFYYLDFISYNIRKSPVTNDIYLKLPYGPVPSTIKNEIDILSAENILGKGFERQLSSYIKLTPGKDGNGNIVVSKKEVVNLKKLSNFELQLIKELAKTFNTTKSTILSNKTHREKPWLSTSDNSVIDYELAEELEVAKILPDFKEA